MLGFVILALVFSLTVAFAMIMAVAAEVAFGKPPAFGPDNEADFAPEIATELLQPSAAAPGCLGAGQALDEPLDFADADLASPAAQVDSPTREGRCKPTAKLAGATAAIVVLAVGLVGSFSPPAKLAAAPQGTAVSALPAKLPARATATKAVYISQTRDIMPRRQASFPRGSADRGRALFVSGRLACPNCHTIEPGEVSFCPNLSAVGSRLPRERIVSSILTPSRDIAPGYQRLTLSLDDGRTVSGYFRGETAARIDLQVDDRLMHFAKAAVTHRQNEKSDMPEGLATSLSPQEFADLVEFLVNQRGSGR